ncbi:MAG: LPS export ABC transporter permease LptF [Pseudohongiellaceae bacterium]
MILFRYLSTQILQVMTAVTLILLVVSFTSRFLQYLADAVAGQMTTDILLLLMLSRLPEFLLVIIPLAFFLGVLLSYGRMYADNEMTVLSACGYSQRRLLGVTMSCSALVAALVAILSLYLSPYGLQSTGRLQQMQQELTELDLIVPGQFQAFNRGRRTTYAESISETDIGRQLNNSFVALRETPGSAGQPGLRVMVSETARPELDEESGRRYMVLENGYYYEGLPGEADFQITEFEEQGILLPEQVSFTPILEEQAMPTTRLWGATEPPQRAELQWRLSVILMIPVLALMSVPLSRVGPRQGRFSKLVPATLLYAGYFLLLELVRERVATGEMAAWPGMWGVHLVFLLLALMLLRPPAALSGLPGFGLARS